MEGTEKSTSRPEVPKVVSCRFPPTRLLKAQYSSLVHDRASQPLSARSLEKALADTENDIDGVLTIPPAHPIVREVQNSMPLLDQAPLPWPTKLKMLRERLSQEIETLQTSLYLQQQQLQMALPAIRTLIQASSQSTAHTAAILNKASFTEMHLEGYRSRGGMDCGQRGCKDKALPFSRFCLNHVNHDSEQVLYRKCSAVSTELLIQCNLVVQDILSEESLCAQHYKGMSSDKAHGKKKTSSGKPKPKPSPGSIRVKKVQGSPKRGSSSGGHNSIPAILQLGLGTQPAAVTPARRRSEEGWGDGDDLVLPASKQPRIGSLSDDRGVTNPFPRTEPLAVDSPLALVPPTAFPPSLSPLDFLPPGPVLGTIMSGESSSASDGDL
ncbi:hypothetical protein EMCRGX_G010921 [Ephydatia muelleri]